LDKAPDAFRTISEVADELDVPQHVLRFWETRFSYIKPMKRGGGRRYYRPDDVDLLRGIRHLLYGEGYTIRGVQRLLKDQGIKFVQSVWREDTAEPVTVRGDEPDADDAATRAREPGVMPAGEAAPIVAAPPRPEPVPLRRDTSFGSALRPPQRPEPVRIDAPSPATVPDAAPPGLGEDDLRRLRGVLEELAECHRLLGAALAEE
jgi:DNA-binding transcriptional MerR regulator